MAIAAADTICRHLSDLKIDASYYDLILTGDLGIYGMNILMGKTITTITSNPIVEQLDSEYRVDNIYLIGNTPISRPKFLRNYEQVKGNTDYLILSLVSNSILDETSYMNLINELNGHKLKK